MYDSRVSVMDVVLQGIGLAFLLGDFCVSAIPVRMAHVIYPLLFNVPLLVMTSRRGRPLDGVADNWSHDALVSIVSISSGELSGF